MTNHPRPLVVFGLLISMCAVPAIGYAERDPSSPGTILRLEITNGATTTRGECFLVYQTSNDGKVTRYFLTFAPLVTGENARVRINGINNETMKVGPENILLPPVNLTPPQAPGWFDVAIIRVTSVSSTMLTEMPVVFDPIENGQLLAIPLRDETGKLVLAAAGPVRLGTDWSAAPLVREGTAAAGERLAGTPVLGPHGVVGLVTGWSEGGQTAFFASLRGAEPFLRGALPGWTPAVVPSPLFTLITRHIEEPTIPVSRTDETAASPRASLMNRQSIRLGDLKVLEPNDNDDIWLRFTMAGTPPKTFPDPGWTAYPIGNALVTVEVNAFVVHKP